MKSVIILVALVAVCSLVLIGKAEAQTSREKAITALNKTGASFFINHSLNKVVILDETFKTPYEVCELVKPIDPSIKIAVFYRRTADVDAEIRWTKDGELTSIPRFSGSAACD